MAAAIGVNHSFVSRAERGVTGLHVDTLEKYLAACGYHLEAVPNDDPTALQVSLHDVPEERRGLAREILEVLPHLPDLLAEDLRDRVRMWRGRFLGPSE